MTEITKIGTIEVKNSTLANISNAIGSKIRKYQVLDIIKELETKLFLEYKKGLHDIEVAGGDESGTIFPCFNVDVQDSSEMVYLAILHMANGLPYFIETESMVIDFIYRFLEPEMNVDTEGIGHDEGLSRIIFNLFLRENIIVKYDKESETLFFKQLEEGELPSYRFPKKITKNEGKDVIFNILFQVDAKRHLKNTLINNKFNIGNEGIVNYLFKIYNGEMKLESKNEVEKKLKAISQSPKLLKIVFSRTVVRNMFVVGKISSGKYSIEFKDRSICNID